MNIPNGSTAVMARRVEPPDSLDFFPTPPWATRALLEHVIPEAGGTAWEPAAGQGHMADVLKERFRVVWRSDVHDYGGLDAVGSFTGVGPDVLPSPDPAPNWIITNPPFNLALEFVERALDTAHDGVAVLLRSTWLESVERYERLFSTRAPAIVAPFVERVPMVKGRWDPSASSATAYTWFVWEVPFRTTTQLKWIPPGCRRGLTKDSDIKRFASRGRP